MSGLSSLLGHSMIYNLFQNLIGAKQNRDQYCEEFIRPVAGMTILDIGCGTAEILESIHVPVQYWGIDTHRDYILFARQRYGQRGSFLWGELTPRVAEMLPAADLVMMIGVLHHVSDPECGKLLSVIRSVLKPGGRLLTIDPCLTGDQHPVARWMITHDRGRHVRDMDGYAALVESGFDEVIRTVRHAPLRIPYTHLIMECRSSAGFTASGR